MQHFCFCPHFSWAELKDLRLFLWTQKAYFSQILFTNLSKSVLVNEIIHPPHSCGISRCWIDSMIIAQVCLRLATIKDHSKMCRFTVLVGPGGLKTSQYLVWPPFASRSATHLLHIELIRLLIVVCGMLVHSSSMASYTPIQSISNMLNGWHVRWVYWPCKNWDVFSFQESCTDPCNMGPCIIMLQHEVMVVDEWHNNGPQDLVTVSPCIQNAINKMHLCCS